MDAALAASGQAYIYELHCFPQEKVKAAPGNVLGGNTKLVLMWTVPEPAPSPRYRECQERDAQGIKVPEGHQGLWEGPQEQFPSCLPAVLKREKNPPLFPVMCLEGGHDMQRLASIWLTGSLCSLAELDMPVVGLPHSLALLASLES